MVLVECLVSNYLNFQNFCCFKSVNSPIIPKTKEITRYLTNCIHSDAACAIKVIMIFLSIEGIGEWMIKCVE